MSERSVRAVPVAVTRTGGAPVRGSVQRGIRAALRAAHMSDCTTRHGAALVRGGRVVAIASNRLRNHPSVVGESHVETECTTHAEVMVLRRAPVHALGADVYVVRVTPSGRVALSMPCSRCMVALEDAGVAEVVYSA